VGIAQKTGFGRVSPLPGIWPSLHLDTSITLPVGVEAYAAYALRAWLGRLSVQPRAGLCRWHGRGFPDLRVGVCRYSVWRFTDILLPRTTGHH
ncbi:MAG TPA: hypothetical protein VHZ03_36760, partial [Trebonia sp.]|nr:hypothetical protein [Trebonia sp.]